MLYHPSPSTFDGVIHIYVHCNTSIPQCLQDDGLCLILCTLSRIDVIQSVLSMLFWTSCSDEMVSEDALSEFINVDVQMITTTTDSKVAGC